MSSPQHRRPPLEAHGGGVCMCARGGACSRFAPGHALHLAQARLADAAPSEWIDAVVASADTGAGEIALAPIDGAAVIVVWHAGDAAERVTAGEPVAVHPRHHVLVGAGARFNVARLASGKPR